MTRCVLLVEDERPLGELVRDNLSLEGYYPEWVTDGQVAVDRLGEGGIDLVILDIMLPGLDGFAVLQAMRGRGDATPVLVLSARSGDEDRIRGLELLADDYLAKPFNLRELLLRVQALLRRSPVPDVGSDILDFGGHRVDFRALRAELVGGKSVELTSSEASVLRMLTARRGQVVTRQEIASQLYGPSAAATVRTLDNLILSLRRHFEPDRSQPRFLHTVRGVGWRFDP